MALSIKETNGPYAVIAFLNAILEARKPQHKEE